jgi:hypothetical protein
MADVTTDVQTQSSPHRRRPAFAVIQRCLAVQAEAKPRPAVAKLLGQNPLHPDARSWYSGAIGEIEVARQLARLGPEYTVFHSVPIGDGDSDIDHVVIGPTGIFTITTENHRGKAVWAAGQTILVDGERTHHVRNSLHEAKRAAELLRRASGGVVAVTPLVVVVGVESINSGDKPAAVRVLPSSRLTLFLRDEPRILRADAIAYYANAADDRATWHSDALGPTDTLRHTQRFDRLQHEVDTARSRRMLWRILLIVASAAVCLLIASTLVQQLGTA